MLGGEVGTFNWTSWCDIDIRIESKLSSIAYSQRLANTNA